jgi:ubiquinone/menaquinone biosynthesis C-methylase UbiE
MSEEEINLGEVKINLGTETLDLTGDLFPVMTGKEDIFLDSEVLKIDLGDYFGYAMHVGERKLTECMAEMVCLNGGYILEIGFGMGMSASAIQKHTNVASHTIVEINEKVYEKAVEWAKDKNNVQIILGDWKNILPTLNKKFDAILHDTSFDNNILKFLDECKHLCKNDTLVVFYYYPHNSETEYNDQNQTLFNVKEFTFTEEDVKSLPLFYGILAEHLYPIEDIQSANLSIEAHTYKDIRYTVFDGEKFVKPSFTL